MGSGLGSSAASAAAAAVAVNELFGGPLSLSELVHAGYIIKPDALYFLNFFFLWKICSHGHILGHVIIQSICFCLDRLLIMPHLKYFVEH